MAGKQGNNARKGVQGFQHIVTPVGPSRPAALRKPVDAAVATDTDAEADRIAQGIAAAYLAYERRMAEEASPSSDRDPLDEQFSTYAHESRMRARVQSETPPADVVHVDETGTITNRCDKCGQFIGETAHTCNKLPMKTKVMFGASLAVTGGMTAGFIALGPVGVAVAVGLALVGLGVKRLIKKYMGATEKQKNERARRRATDPSWQNAEAAVTDLSSQLGVEGEVQLIPKEMMGAGAVRKNRKESLIYISDEILDMPEPQMRGVLAHELAHLQKHSAGRPYHVLKSAAFPVAVTAGAITGLAALPAAGVAVGVYFMTLMASNAAQRVEENRADREAYKVSGEDYAKALDALHQSHPETFRRNLVWRLEDVMFNHPSLPNRLNRMRRNAPQPQET